MRPTSASEIKTSMNSLVQRVTDSKVHGANMEPTWGRQEPGGPHIGHMNFAIWGGLGCQAIAWTSADLLSIRSTGNKQQWTLNQEIQAFFKRNQEKKPRSPDQDDCHFLTIFSNAFCTLSKLHWIIAGDVIYDKLTLIQENGIQSHPSKDMSSQTQGFSLNCHICYVENQNMKRRCTVDTSNCFAEISQMTIIPPINATISPQIL